MWVGAGGARIGGAWRVGWAGKLGCSRVGGGAGEGWGWVRLGEIVLGNGHGGINSE